MSMRKIRKLFWNFVIRKICVKNFSEEDTERISMSYRCRNGQEFRWVSMEIIKSTEYAKDNEVVVLYLRDINTDYLKQLDMVLSRSKGSVGMVNVNVTDGTCKSGSSSLKNLELQEEDRTLDQYINRISTSIPQEDGRRSFTENFQQKAYAGFFRKRSHGHSGKFIRYTAQKTIVRSFIA